MLLALVLFAQVFVAPHAYLAGEPDALATLTGTYAIERGEGCENVVAPVNVELLPGSGGVAAIAPLGTDIVCNIFIGDRLSDAPCLQADGVCDLDGQ